MTATMTYNWSDCEHPVRLDETRVGTAYPCCADRATRLSITPHVPREKYDRRCPGCGKRWTVERTTGATAASGWYRTDRFVWTPQP